jgi:MarR family transcriptional regulator, 2-MHQ and catechol-resistance regulon repressor
MSKTPAPYELLLAMLLVQNSLERRSEAFFQPFGLTASKFNILNLLSMKNGQMDQSELVDQLLVGKSSISIVLNRMVRDNLIRRESHPKDRRQVVLVITKKGNEIWSKVAPDYEENVREIFGRVPPSHRNQFLQDLKKLHEAISVQDTQKSSTAGQSLSSATEKVK